MAPLVNEQRLATAWDELFHHLAQYDFSRVVKVFIDDITLGTDRNPACHYQGTIVLDPSVFKMTVWDSAYTGIESDKPLHFALAHEIFHYLVATGQEDPGNDEEEAADLFAAQTLKEMQ